MTISNSYQLDESPRRLGELCPTPDGERNDRAALWRRLREQAYLYLPGMLDPETVLAFRAYYFGSLRGSGLWDETRDAVAGIAVEIPVDQARMRHQLFKTVVPSEAYAQFCTQPALLGWFGWLLAEEVICTGGRFCITPGQGTPVSI